MWAEIELWPLPHTTHIHKNNLKCIIDLDTRMKTKKKTEGNLCNGEDKNSLDKTHIKIVIKASIIK